MLINSLIGPWSNVIDFFEVLQYLPSSKRARGNRLNATLRETYGGMIVDFKNKMMKGEDVPDCLVKTLLENQESEKLDWEDVCMLSGVFTLGGVHSVSLHFSFCECQRTKQLPVNEGLRNYTVVHRHASLAP